MAIVGYARVSSTGRDLTVQLEKLKGCDKVFQEKRSGVDAGRPELKACLEFLREGRYPDCQQAGPAGPLNIRPLPHHLGSHREGSSLQGDR